MEPGVGNGTGEIRSNLAFILAAGPTVFAGMWGQAESRSTTRSWSEVLGGWRAIS